MYTECWRRPADFAFRFFGVGRLPMDAENREKAMSCKGLIWLGKRTHRTQKTQKNQRKEIKNSQKQVKTFPRNPLSPLLPSPITRQDHHEPQDIQKQIEDIEVELESKQEGIGAHAAHLLDALDVVGEEHAENDDATAGE